MMLSLHVLVLLGLSCTRQVAESADPWGQCPASRKCKDKFGDGSCDKECTEPECLRDGMDCVKDRGPCNPGHIPYCRNHYANSQCDKGCDNAPCGWDGGDCSARESALWAKGTLVVHATIPHKGAAPAFTNTSLLWALSVLLRSPLVLRGLAPLAADKSLFDLDPQQLVDLLAKKPAGDSDGSLVFLQMDNRPCSRQPSTCFPHATEAASFLRAITSQGSIPYLAAYPPLPELKAVVAIRGVQDEIGARDERGGTGTGKQDVREPTPTWIWLVVAIATGLLLALALTVFLVVRRARRARRQREIGGGGEAGEQRARHRSAATAADGKAKTWTANGAQQQAAGRPGREKEKDKSGLRKKKKAKEAEKKRRREPLGEDAMRMRPLKRDQDVASDTDFTQSSLEDVRTCRRQEDVKHCRAGGSQQRRPTSASSRVWERNAMPPPLLSPPQQSAEWCGPDGSVVLIRAVRSGLDRVVLELLRAGVSVNNTDHTGRSALHWACSVNHLSLTRTLIRYGAAVDLQDNKGETPLFLSAFYGCYDTARLLLLHGANLELHDRRGRRPIDVAREGLHHQVLELLLAHQIQRSPATEDTANDMLWEERALMYSPWIGTQGRSASFSGMVAHRDVTASPQSNWSVSSVQYPSPQNWRPQLNQSATALVPPRIMGRSPRPISTLQEVTSEDEDRDRRREPPRAVTPHFLSPQPAPRQRSFSCTQHALQRRSSSHQVEPNYVIVTERTANEHIERVIVSPPPEPASPSGRDDRAEQANVSAGNSEPKSRGERSNNATDATQTAL
ncbi:uncharacterized protein notchl [Stigmatopora argus]